MKYEHPQLHAIMHDYEMRRASLSEDIGAATTVKVLAIIADCLYSIARSQCVLEGKD